MTIDPKLLAAEMIIAAPTAYLMLVRRLDSSADGVQSLPAVFLQLLDEDSTLPNSEKERRMAELVKHSRLSGVSLRDLAVVAREIKNPILRNGVARLLPPELRSLMSPKSSLQARASGNAASPLDLPAPLITSADSGLETVQIKELQLNNEAADVVFLSVDEDPASRKLLEARFTVLRYPTLVETKAALKMNEDICAFIVEPSFLALLSTKDQKDLLETLAAYSTFAWIKIAERNLSLTREAVFDIIAEARCAADVPTVKQVQLAERGGLQQRDLESIEACRSSLAREKSASLFVPGEIDDAELRLLVAALTDYVRRRHFRLKASVTSIKTKFVQSRMPDDAKVAIVRVNELQIPIIVKVASGQSREIIRDEVIRFRTFIQAGDKDLNPEVHLHGRSALIIFGLIESGDNEQEPAPTLDEVLKSFWSAEMWGSDLSQQRGLITRAFSKALKKVVQLNSTVYQEQGFECKANPYLDALKKMEARGFDWGFGKQALDERTRSEELIEKTSRKAVAQGDLHTRNILVRGENGFLIDYAYSGPGHPCADLTRLELSVFLNYFTPFVPENILIDLQRDLTRHRFSADQLFLKYPDAFRSTTNRVCIELCVMCREAVSAVLEAHALGWEHYRAVKLLSSWQALQVASLQRSLVRVVITAI